MTYLFFLTTNHLVWAISKPFNFKEVQDGERDWIRVIDGQPNRNGINATDISSVKYNSDGNVLDATLWFSSLGELNQSKYKIHTIVYGMLIDSDLDSSTGKDGIDYLVELKWSNATNTWTEEINEMSANGFTSLVSSPVTHNESYIKNGHVVKLSLNLSKISHPEKYKVFFYAYNSNKDNFAPWTLDLVRWIYIPPPEFRLVTDDPVINTSQHNKEIIEIRVETDSGLEPKVRFEQENRYNYLDTKYEPSVLNMTDEDKTELTITTDSPDIRKITIPIKARISFPTQYLDAHSVIRNQATNVSGYAIVSQNSLTEPLNLRLKISEDPPVWEPLSEFWSALSEFFNFIYTPIAAFVAWFVGIYMAKHPEKFKKIILRKNKGKKSRGKNTDAASAGLS